jgi:hypothetical protein
MFSTFDSLTTKHNVYKVETIGDAYLACSGVVNRCATQTEDLVKFAMDLQTSTRYMHTPEGQPIVIRIGIHTGSVVAGVVGRKMPRYHLFGETVTIAEEMEQNGIAGAVVISEMTYAECEGLFEVEKLEPVTLHAKPAKNILPAEKESTTETALITAISNASSSSSSSFAPSVGSGKLVPATSSSSTEKHSNRHATLLDDAHKPDEHRLVHRYRVICHNGDMGPHRASAAGNAYSHHINDHPETASSKSRQLLLSNDEKKNHLDPSTAMSNRRTSINSPGQGAHGGIHEPDEFDRAPPPFVSQILARINARNFQEYHARQEKQQAKITVALNIAKEKTNAHIIQTYQGPEQTEIQFHNMESPERTVMASSPPIKVY